MTPPLKVAGSDGYATSPLSGALAGAALGGNAVGGLGGIFGLLVTPPQLDLLLLGPNAGEEFAAKDQYTAYTYLLIPDVTLAGEAAHRALRAVSANFTGRGIGIERAWGAFVVPTRTDTVDALEPSALDETFASFALERLGEIRTDGGGVWLVMQDAPLPDIRKVLMAYRAKQVGLDQLEAKFSGVALPNLRVDPVDIRALSESEMMCLFRLLRRDVYILARRAVSKNDVALPVLDTARAVRRAVNRSALRKFIDGVGRLLLTLNDGVVPDTRADEVFFMDERTKKICDVSTQ